METSCGYAVVGDMSREQLPLCAHILLFPYFVDLDLVSDFAEYVLLMPVDHCQQISISDICLEQYFQNSYFPRSGLQRPKIHRPELLDLSLEFFFDLHLLILILILALVHLHTFPFVTFLTLIFFLDAWLNEIHPSRHFKQTSPKQITPK